MGQTRRGDSSAKPLNHSRSPFLGKDMKGYAMSAVNYDRLAELRPEQKRPGRGHLYVSYYYPTLTLLEYPNLL